MFVHADGSEMSFSEVVSALLVEEWGRTESDAKALVGRYPQIIINGIMSGVAYRATAMALEMAEEAAEAGGHE